MSIRTSFNPLGTLGGGELPYVQPIMTSKTTWSNEPSFGWDITGLTVIHGSYAPWNAFDSDQSSIYQWIPAQNGDVDAGVIAFEQPITLYAVEVTNFADAAYGYRLKGGLIFYSEENEELCRVVFSSGIASEVRRAELAAPRRLSRLKLYSLNGGGYTNIKFEATYKP